MKYYNIEDSRVVVASIDETSTYFQIKTDKGYIFEVVGKNEYENLEKENEKLAEMISKMKETLKYMTEDYDCDPEDVADFDKRKAEITLAEVERMEKELK